MYNSSMKKLTTLLLTAALVITLTFTLAACGSAQTGQADEGQEAQAAAQAEAAAGAQADLQAEGAAGSKSDAQTGFSLWSEDAPAVAALTDYVERVTDENSDSFIPAERRIAVFDFDGTLFCEQFPAYVETLMFIERVQNDSSYKPDSEVRDFAVRLQGEIDAGNKWGDDTEKLQAEYGARAFAGMTVAEYCEYCKSFTNRPADCFANLKRKDAFYKPMLQVVDYLQANGFIVYIVSGTDRSMIRTMIDGVIDIPPSQVIGSDVLLEATNQKGEDGLEYVYDREKDEVVRSDRLIVKDVKMNKVSQMAQEICYQPVLAFGNSTGDYSMIEYSLDDNPYEAMGFFLLADDVEREYGNLEKSKAFRRDCKERGWVSISMADDFVTIYGDDVTITGKKDR